MPESKDVIFLCQYFHPEYISSATLPFDTAVALRNAGYSVGALVGYPKEYSTHQTVPMREIFQGIDIKRIKYLQLNRTNSLGRLINYLSFTLSCALQLRHICKYTTVLVYSNPPILPLIAVIGRNLFGLKIVFISYDVYPDIAYKTGKLSPHSLMAKVMTLVNNLVFRRVSRVVALSEDMKSYLVANRDIKPEQVEVIPNWYEGGHMPTGSRAQSNALFAPILGTGKLIVSYFGNLGICQDLSTILAAIRTLAHNPEIHFIFAGHGNKMHLMREIVEQERLDNVTIFDFLHGADYQDALDISDCFLVSLEQGLAGLAVPSKTYGYMMAGKPIIAVMDQCTDIARDLTENNAGISIKVGDHAALVAAITALRDSPENRRRMGANSRQLFLAKYTKEIATAKYVAMMAELID
ncbi:glycosyltransferase family 4 protein [Allosphingosinicella vermicomposti]|uniref:glycosyltransferase family 4 protein n=1 Tax=Allosphingosinicella vermicomposti TaxID=614671 RepID=UPI000D107A38|nr:glycosyltransferase family 4 protein [Allosphingosinicella vermicomposti]